MGYSVSKPFCTESKKSLYGEKYDEYVKRRLAQIENKTEEEIRKENPCLILEDIKAFEQGYDLHLK